MPDDLWLALFVGLVPAVAAMLYFWRGDRRDRRRVLELHPPQEAEVLVDGACHPARLVLDAGRPLRLHFTRKRDGESWWDDLDFPYAHVARELPEGARVTVDVEPLDAGEYTYFCAQGTKRGALVIEDKGASTPSPTISPARRLPGLAGGPVDGPDPPALVRPPEHHQLGAP